METLLEPFGYAYMVNALALSTLVGGVCALLSAFLMLRGWSLIGDALSHAIVPGVAGAYLLALPFAVGAFIAAILASGAMVILRQQTDLKQDAVIGLAFTGFFGLGLFMASIAPMAVDIHVIMLGNILAIAPEDGLQVLIISLIILAVIAAKWKDLMLIFFDPAHAKALGLRVGLMQVLFFGLLSAACVAAMQTVGAFLVVAMVITPGATAYLLVKRFSQVLLLSLTLGLACSFFGVYLAYFLDLAVGGSIICLLTTTFLAALFCGPNRKPVTAERGQAL